MRELAELPVDAIHPNPRQPRKRFDSDAGAGLADSVRAQGVVQPVLVRPRAAGGYELIAGERRWRAAREAKVPTVPAVVREADDRDSLLLGLVEIALGLLLEHIHAAMKPGSLLFVGHSENFTDSRDLFVLQGKTIYKRV